MDESSVSNFAAYEKQLKELTSRVDRLESKGIEAGKKKQIMIFMVSGSMEKAFATFMVANWATTVGYRVNIYFTLWGLNLLRIKTDFKDNSIREVIVKTLMKRGPDKAILSQLHLLGIGSQVVRDLLKENKFSSVSELMESASEIGVQFWACEVMMGAMGIKKEELRPDVQVKGGMDYIKAMSESSVNLVI